MSVSPHTPSCKPRCQQRAEELQLPHLVAYARLALAKFGLQYHPSTAGPADGAAAHDTATGTIICSQKASIAVQAPITSVVRGMLLQGFL